MTRVLAVGIALCAASGGAAALLRSRPVAAQRAASAVLCAGAALGVTAALAALFAPAGLTSSSPRLPFGAASLRVDALAALFLLPILAVPALGSIYGLRYFPQQRWGGRSTRVQVFYGLVTAGMALVVAAGNAALFLVGWEVMALSAFVLVLTQHDRPSVQRAAFTYLATTRVATVCLFAMFALLFRETGTLDLGLMKGVVAADSRAGFAIFALALGGFGLKAGLVPLHFWLPEAHAAAPTHVSALMSGVLIKTGIYGLLRTTGLFEAPPASWGFVILALGAASAVLGVAFALAQHDLKRLLAYHSVENVGIIAMGAGLALLGRSRGDPALTALGVAGAVLHVVNHATFKSLLFLGAGAVEHGCGTRRLDLLGGLARKMPLAATLFLVGAAAISGLPPLNGFVSEWLVAMAAVAAMGRPSGDPVAFGALAAPALAVVGALAAACFVKVHGTVFLGSPRSDATSRAHEPPRAMWAPMAALAVACAVIGLLPQLVAPALVGAAAEWAGIEPAAARAATAASVAAASRVSLGGAVLVLSAAAIAALRRRRLPAPQPAADTWACGFAHPTPRMQYTASSFAEGLVRRFEGPVRVQVERALPDGPFPASASFHTHAPDTVLDLFLVPLLRRASAVAVAVRSVTPVRVSFHAMLVIVTLLAVLAWRFHWW